MNPANDLFVSMSKDTTVRLWDLAEKTLVAIYEHARNAAFDNTGMVLAAAYSAADVNKNPKETQRYYINLYETNPCKGTPFSTFELEEGEVKKLKFSNNGQNLLCTTESGYCILDAYSGEKKQKFEPLVTPESGVSLEGCFTPDSQYFICGSEDGVILIWNVRTGKQICKLEKHFKTVNCVKFSNKYAILVSACQNVLFWQMQPKPSLLDEGANSHHKDS
eukprot:TRINITY_DN11795_c0_g1_i4.p1 TRINITY_DN11795_c0_g1~~TRINITY_DN11795_c0_g1_i4.p1  ORF type:complete len:220 (+),score=55.18 TRINITY_DN11795_c0_g1_i4:592-1251(+)